MGDPANTAASVIAKHGFVRVLNEVGPFGPRLNRVFDPTTKLVLRLGVTVTASVAVWFISSPVEHQPWRSIDAVFETMASGCRLGHLESHQQPVGVMP